MWPNNGKPVRLWKEDGTSRQEPARASSPKAQELPRRDVLMRWLSSTSRDRASRSQNDCSACRAVERIAFLAALLSHAGQVTVNSTSILLPAYQF